jgi:O-antigen/teichoic acid export membrane protein
VLTRLNSRVAQLSKRFELDISYFLRGGFWLSLPLIGTYILGLVRTVVFARALDQNVYGQFSFVVSLSSALMIFSLPGMAVALVETASRGNYGATLDATRARFRWGLLTTLALTGWSLYYVYQGEEELAIAVALSGLFMPFIASLQMVQGYFNGRKQFARIGFVNLLIELLSTSLIFLVIIRGGDVAWLIIANSLGQIAIYAGYYLCILPNLRLAPRDPDMVVYGRALTWAQSITLIASYLDGVALGLLVSFADVAVYNIAAILPNNLQHSMRLLIALLMPKLAERPNKQIYTARTRSHLLFLLFINIIFVLAMMVMLSYLLPVLYGPQYADSVRYAQLLMLGFVFNLPSYFFLAALQARKQTSTIRNYNYLYALIQIGSLFLFVPLWGVFGVVVSRIITQWLTTFYQWRMVRKI